MANRAVHAIQFAVDPSVLLFTGRTGQTIRPRLMASSPEASHAVQSIDVSPWSDVPDVADEVVERMLSNRRNRADSRALALLVIADSNTDWQKTLLICHKSSGLMGDRLIPRIQVISDAWMPAIPSMGVQSAFLLAPTFRGFRLDAEARERALVHLVAAFSFSMRSMMEEEGFDAFRERSAGHWLAAVEALEMHHPRRSALANIESVLKAEVYPFFTARVRSELAARARAVKFPPPSDLAFGVSLEQWLFGCGRNASCIQDIRESLQAYSSDSHAALLARELLRIENALRDSPAGDRTAVPGVDEIFRVAPLPVLQHSEVLRRTSMGAHLEQAMRKLAEREFCRLILELRRDAEAKHYSWCAPNSTAGARAVSFTHALALSRAPLDTRQFLFLPHESAINDLDERWLRDDTVAWIDLASIGGAQT